jgi:hypothetical protein
MRYPSDPFTRRRFTGVGRRAGALAVLSGVWITGLADIEAVGASECEGRVLIEKRL